MAHFGKCLRCNHELHTGIISGDIRSGGLAICTHCGWYESKAQEKANIKTENRAIVAMAITAVAVLALTAHMISWGGYAFSSPLLKIGQWTRTLGTQGYIELSEACLNLGKINCAKQALIDNYQQNRDLESLARLANIQVRNQETQSAMVTYAAYFNANGQNGEAALSYGQLLEQAGQDSEALRMMEQAISLRPDTLPITATGAIVRILMKEGRYAEAQDRLMRFHASAENAKGYLNTELSQIQQAIKLYGSSPRRG